MSKTLAVALSAAAAITAAGPALAADQILSFGTMVGVDGAFVNHNPIRGVIGDELPWEVGSANGSLDTDGHLVISIRGLVFPNDPEVPANLRGINDEENFRALVSCLDDEGQGRGTPSKPATVNLVTEPFPATRSGDSNIDAHVTLPHYCVAPIVFILSGSEDKWFAVTGAEIGGD
jgi:hypothetical protein